VILYRVEFPCVSSNSNCGSLSLSILRTLSVSLWGFSPLNIGAVNCMEWSSDGNVIAVGWFGRGLVVWTSSGTRVACTLPQLPPQTQNLNPQTNVSNTNQHTPQTNTHGAPQTELLGNGVNALVINKPDQHRSNICICIYLFLFLFIVLLLCFVSVGVLVVINY
jgi:hypothetical protein